MIILICIAINILILTFNYKGENRSFKESIRSINYFFLGVFNIEFIIKISSDGFLYFKDSWNKFDFLVLLSSDIVLIGFEVVNDNNEISNLPLILRALRLAKIVKYFKTSVTVWVLIDTYFYI